MGGSMNRGRPSRPFPGQGITPHDARAVHMPEPVYDVPAEEGPFFEQVLHEHGGAPMQPPEYPRFREGQREQPEHDTLRWGDGDIIRAVAAVGVPLVGLSKQLARASVPRPIVWIVFFNSDLGAVVPAGEAAAINIIWNLKLGCGQSRTTRQYTLALLPAGFGGVPYAVPPNPLTALQIPVPPFPAQDVQINAFVSYTPTVAGPVAIPVAAMIAPWAHAPIPLGEGRHANDCRY